MSEGLSREGLGSLQPNACPGCGQDKKTYPYRKAAVLGAAKASRKIGFVRIYYCPNGAGWHITKQERSGQRRPR